ncbi:uncharacterized protein LOC107264887 isoform X1 [Cephus cinctus]|uniref:Uncharacterized protein LOC107264887 isoform X1 n=1 Tax=Cephus cinctus TaxID=211228 RepID=A0AAJ7RCG7_CEPCN|nr:uncharacterized protein LOC107264887 isoform X1 [Cephus cinctus]
MSCFGGHDEQLYLIELMVDKLKLTLDKIKDVGKSKLVVKIRFLDFPIFAISTNDFTGTMISSMPDENGVINLSSGESCLFVRKPKVLVEELKKNVKYHFLAVFVIKWPWLRMIQIMHLSLIHLRVVFTWWILERIRRVLLIWIYDESEFCVKPVITTGVPGDVVELEEMKCPDSILPESFDEEKRPQRTSK